MQLYQDEHGRAGGWTPTKVALELGAITKARSQRHDGVSYLAPPTSSRLFTHLQFTKEATSRTEFTNDDEVNPNIVLLEDDDSLCTTQTTSDSQHPGSTTGGWLEDDDIEDFDY